MRTWRHYSKLVLNYHDYQQECESFRSRTIDLLLAMPSQEVAIVAAQVPSSQNASSDNCCRRRRALTSGILPSKLPPLVSALCAGRLSPARAVVDVGAA